jgi:hypothetical protein
MKATRAELSVTHAKNARLTSMFQADYISQLAPQGLEQHNNGVGLTMAAYR